MSKLLAILIFVAFAMYADTIRFIGLPSNTQYGTYNGYSSATVDGVPLQMLICDDFGHTTNEPSGPMDFSLSTLTSPTPLQYARFVDPNRGVAITRYEQAAILLDGLNHTGPGLLLDMTADYQYALWMLFTPGVNAPNATAQTLLNDAAYSVRQGGPANLAIYSELRIYTPTASYVSNQEFLQLGAHPPDPTAIPETSPAILIWIGMAGIALSVAARRLLQRRGRLA